MATVIVIDGTSDLAASHSTLPENGTDPPSPVMCDTSRRHEDRSSSKIITGWRLQLVVFSFVACPRVFARLHRIWLIC